MELLKTILGNILENPNEEKYRSFSRTKSVLTHLEDTPGRIKLLIHLGFRTQVINFQRRWFFLEELISLKQLQVGFDYFNQIYTNWMENDKKEQLNKQTERKEQSKAWNRQQILIQEDREIRAWRSEFVSPVVTPSVSSSTTLPPVSEVKRATKWAGKAHKL